MSIWIVGNNMLMESIRKVDRPHLEFNTSQTSKLHKELYAFQGKEKVILSVSLNKCILNIFCSFLLIIYVNLEQIP